MKRYQTLTFCAVLTVMGLAANFAAAQVADPQRPDGVPAADPQTVPVVVQPFDPQRPDEKQPPAKNQYNPNQPQVIQLTLSPAAEPVPALKYELLPGSLERVPGNGATNYYRALLHSQQVLSTVPQQERENYSLRYGDWFNKPLQDLSKNDKQEMEKWVGYFRNALMETRLAAYREQCHFDLRLQDLRGLETINMLLHDFQQSRELGRALRLRARLEVSQGKLDEAIETVRQGLQLGKDTTEPELIINGLIGIAICSMMQDELVEIIQQPGSPNLYWALSSLPRPIIDLRRGVRFEMDLPVRMFPFLRDAERAQRTPEEWQMLMVDSLNQITEVAGSSARPPEWQSRLVAAGGLLMLYPEAKKQLLEEGFNRDELEKMPVAQVVAIQASRAQTRVYHNIFKWTSLPYSQQGTRADDSFKQMLAGMGGAEHSKVADPLMLARLLLPGVQQAMNAEIRLQANFAALQTIEALRMHAADNGGKLPRSLDEVTIVPVPMNPATDKPFPYEFRDGVATLTVPPTVGAPAANGRQYVLRMKGP